MYKFKMLTVKLLFCQIQSEDWLVTIDLKDAQFHVEILGTKITSIWLFCSA